jgi:hypothetical protein
MHWLFLGFSGWGQESNRFSMLGKGKFYAFFLEDGACTKMKGGDETIVYLKRILGVLIRLFIFIFIVYT